MTSIFAFDNAYEWFHMQIINFEFIMYKYILCEEMQAFVCLFSFSKQYMLCWNIKKECRLNGQYIWTELHLAFIKLLSFVRNSHNEFT